MSKLLSGIYGLIDILTNGSLFLIFPGTVQSTVSLGRSL